MPRLGAALSRKKVRLLARLVRFFLWRQGSSGAEKKWGDYVDNRVAIIAIIVEDINKAVEVNSVLHGYSDFIIGRMGLPYRQRNINIISVVVDAPHDEISALSGKIGRLDGVSAKTIYSKS